MNKTVLVLLSGFLGAGKTTLMLSAAEHLRSKGITVACITNDQGGQLVDSQLVLHKRLPLQQVQGGCFCCRFDDLADSIKRIIAGHRPQVILAEAVGSCTDLTATVIKPLSSFYGGELDIRPLTVVTDPHRLSELCFQSSPFNKEVVYIMEKQLEEAGCVLLNKTDTLSEERTEQLAEAVKHTFAPRYVLAASAVTGHGVERWLEHIFSADVDGLPVLDIDYDTYAAGEAQLGWLNASVTFDCPGADAGRMCAALMDNALYRFNAAKAEVAHFKIWAHDGRNGFRMNAIDNRGASAPEPFGAAPWIADRFTVWLNARVHIEAPLLRDIVCDALQHIRKEHAALITVDTMDCFSPSRPAPTYRMA